MDFHLSGGSPSSSSTTSSSNHRPATTSNHHQNGALSLSSPSPSSNTDPMHSWWESISKARSRIHLLSTLLPSTTTTTSAGEFDDPSTFLSSLADTDRPARSLLLSSAAYSALSAALSGPNSGAGDDPLCQWLYDTFLSSDPELRLVVLSYLPVLAATYLRRIHHPDPAAASLSGFEAVLLALYSSEAKARNGMPVTVTIPDLSQPSLYHSPRKPAKSSPNSANSQREKPLIGVLSPPLEPQVAVKSTKRACIVGVGFDCYYKQISQMPIWSKIDFCKSVAGWAGQDCPCTSDFDKKPENFDNGFVGSGSFGSDVNGEIENAVEKVKYLDIKGHEDDDHDDDDVEDERIPLPWELLQPVLRILGHCLLGPLNGDEVKDAASVAVRRLYARASHDLVPQAILATRSLIQLDKRGREAAKEAAELGTASTAGSTANTPSKAKKPEILLVSK